MANNPYVNKVQYGNSVLLDLTSDTATADKVASGYTFHSASGASVSGTAQLKQSVTWHQCPTLVRNYLDNVTYDPSDYTTSQIATYAPATAVTSNTKPIGQTVDGVTYYNEVPNEETPYSSTNQAGTVKPLDALRWLNTVVSSESIYYGANTRDLGGWSCDGGTVKYGMLIRGGIPNSADKALMVDTVGVKHELDLRGNEALGYSAWDVPYTAPSTYAWYSIADTSLWKQLLRCVFDTVNKNVPLYFHCSAGADRTATLACVLEALLGMSQSDIDKDYELTCFYTGTGSDTNARRRNESEWTGLITAIKSVTLEGGLADTFRNRAVSFVLSLGFTIDEINAFRTAMIDGTPTAITVSMDNYSVTKSGSNVTFDNSISSVAEFQPYEVNLSANSGYVITGITVTMGGTDVTSLYFSGTKVNQNRSITSSLSDSTSNNSKEVVIDGQSYGAIITPNTDKEIVSITVTMGGVDISSSAVTLIEEE